MRAFVHVVTRILWYATGIVEVLLALRLASFLLGASNGAPVVALLYRVTDAILIPFAGIFKNVSLGDGSVLDLVTLTAMFGYLIGTFLISELLGLFSRRLLPPRPNA
jgi:uncharacterized protein YggT (Ycf19 family)